MEIRSRRRAYGDTTFQKVQSHLRSAQGRKGIIVTVLPIARAELSIWLEALRISTLLTRSEGLVAYETDSDVGFEIPRAPAGTLRDINSSPITREVIINNAWPKGDSVNSQGMWGDEFQKSSGYHVRPCGAKLISHAL